MTDRAAILAAAGIVAAAAMTGLGIGCQALDDDFAVLRAEIRDEHAVMRADIRENRQVIREIRDLLTDYIAAHPPPPPRD